METTDLKSAIAVGERLRQIREKMLLKQADFAQVLSINQNAYSQIENGKRLPTSEQVRIIIENYDVSYEWLMNGIIENDKNALADSQEGYNLPDCRTTMAVNEMLKKECASKDELIAYLQKMLDAKSREFEYAMKSVSIAEQQALTLAGIIDRLTK